MTDLVPINSAEPEAGAKLTLPSAVSAVLADGYGGPGLSEWSSARALAILKRDGKEGMIPGLAQRALFSLYHSPDEVTKHLTLVGGSMAGTREFESAAAWLAQVQRLTSDIATDILIAACDEWQKTNRFLPSVAELRAIAEPRMERRRRAAARLDAMARYLASGQPIPTLLPAPAKAETKRGPNGPMTPEQVEEWNEIMAKAGALTRYRPDGSRYEVAKDGKTPRHQGPPKMPTRADYIALGVDPAILDAA